MRLRSFELSSRSGLCTHTTGCSVAERILRRCGFQIAQKCYSLRSEEMQSQVRTGRKALRQPTTGKSGQSLAEALKRTLRSIMKAEAQLSSSRSIEMCTHRRKLKRKGS